jgi:hypothetical protein
VQEEESKFVNKKKISFFKLIKLVCIDFFGVFSEGLRLNYSDYIVESQFKTN